ncbi:uncharacterized protein LOC108680257 isoform X2 [Hyalella azteca]|uniref:Uncharacterized protein LOC108680257 isoform X2 n=1 Tax=Hyalella azteca TaxID=294128 RepID=A0A979FLE2_HYAAZ|nr:uncharacterized protein LOC108680257 isoform X2 [Hyalella azteca]
MCQLRLLLLSVAALILLASAYASEAVESDSSIPPLESRTRTSEHSQIVVRGRRNSQKKPKFVFPSSTEESDSSIPPLESRTRTSEHSPISVRGRRDSQMKSKFVFPSSAEEPDSSIPRLESRTRTSEEKVWPKSTSPENLDAVAQVQSPQRSVLQNSYPDTEGRSLRRDSNILMQTLRALGSILPTPQSATTKKDEEESSSATKAENSKPVVDKADAPTRPASDGFSLANLMPDGLRALEGLDDILRSTVPRFDRFNCLERVMCEIAAPLGDEDGPGLGDTILNGVQTLQQLGETTLLSNFLPNSGEEPSDVLNQFNSPHRQQFLQHQAHQQNLIQQQVQQQTRPQFPTQQLVPQQQLAGPQQRPAVPPLPYYIPTPVERQHERGPVEYLVSKDQYNEGRQEYQDNYIRREAPYDYQSSQSSYLPQHQQPPPPSQPQYQQAAPSHQYHTYYQQHPHQYHHRQPQQREIGQSHQQHQRADHVYQQPHEYHNRPPHHAPQTTAVPRWRRFVNNVFGSQRRRRTNRPQRPVRRNRRDTAEENNGREEQKVETSKAQRSSRGGSRQAKISPMWETGTRKAKSKAEGPSDVKTLTREDLEVIKSRIQAINREVLKEAARNGTSSFSGRKISGRRARFLDSFINGWSAKTFLGLLDNLMDGYSFHPYTHAAYMGYTSRAGTCQAMYPRCPDSANDWLDFMNNFNRYFPDGVPFRDSLPWPLNLLLP